MKFDLHTLIIYLPELLQSLKNTLWITFSSLLIGIIFGFIACLIKMQNDSFYSKISSNVIDFFRTIPEMVLIFWVFTPIIFSILNAQSNLRDSFLFNFRLFLFEY